MKEIKTEKQYKKALSDVSALIRVGEDKLTEAEAKRIDIMANAIQEYEAIHYPLYPVPKAITGTVELL